MAKKNKKTAKLFFILFLSFTLSFSPIGAKKSEAWMAIPSQFVKQMLEQIAKRIEGIILGMQKQMAAETLVQMVDKLMTSGGNARFIVNWEDYLMRQPEQLTKKYMNDYLGKTLSGKGMSNYVPKDIKKLISENPELSKTYAYANEGFFISPAAAAASSRSNSVSSNYYQQLMEMAKKATTEKEVPKVTYEGNPAQMFADGTLKKFSQWNTGINLPAVYVHGFAVPEYKKKLEENKKIAEAKSIAYQGVKGSGEKKDGTGNIKNPGSLIKDAVANVQDIGNKIIADATHPEEILVSMVTKFLNKAIAQGIGQVQSMVDKQVNDITNKATNELNNQINQFGPGATFGNPSSGTPSSGGSSGTAKGACAGKKDGETCKLNNPYKGKTEGKCKNGLCWPVK